ncbi:MAG: ATP-binding protein [Gammaproteobacteria bacterium]|nr:ATP-binding protein [Gammaproteobacteria bacterium]
MTAAILKSEDATKCFPTGIARGEAFINRHVERNQLQKNILANRHLVLMAPRRYGKTSLITEVASEINIPFCMVDFMTVHDDLTVRDALYEKVGKLVMELLPPIQQAKEKLLNIFGSMKPELALSAFGQKLTFHTPSNPISNIVDVLLKLDEAAVHFDKRAIIFIDEMQQISFLKNASSIEGSIRHAVERSRNITYCFSGSSRHLLRKMFGDKERPLYRLCHTFELERIAKEHYRQSLNKLALERWAEHLSSESFEAVLDLTESHPFYVNALCQVLWMEKNVPSMTEVQETWRNYVRDNRHIISDDVIGLSLNQKKVLSILAKEPAKEIYGAGFTVKTGLSLSSIRKAVDVLMEKDLIHVVNAHYTLVDPAIRYYLDNLL